ncbi:hypothetical protein [Salinifilum ghardaiensis]
MNAEPVLKVSVPEAGDVALEERFLRSLRADLVEVEGLSAQLAADSADAPNNAKAGAALGEVALWVTVGTVVGRGAVSVLLEGIRAWSAKQHDRVVHIRTEDGSEYRLPADMDAAQRHLTERIAENEGS